MKNGDPAPGPMVRLLAMALAGVAWAACGGATPGKSGAAAADDGYVLSEALAGCETVCFEWGPPVGPEPPVQDECGRAVYTDDRCRTIGEAPGACPQGFRCGAPITQVSTHATFVGPVCEPEGPPPFDLRFDVASRPETVDPVAVELRVTLNGGPWPESQLVAGAGSMWITPRAGGKHWTDLVPTSSPGVVTVELDRGDYDLYVSIGPYYHDHTVYPGVHQSGTLVVREAGVVEVPLEGVEVHYRVEVDGVPVVEPGADFRWANVSFQNDAGQGWWLRVHADEPFEGTMVLAPGAYQPQVWAVADGPDSALPEGLSPTFPLVVTAGEPVEHVLNLETVAVSGTVRVDGQDLPPADSSGSVVLRAPDRTISLEVSSDRPATFAGRVYPGSYSIGYDGADTDMAGIPQGFGVSPEPVVAGEGLALDLPTVDMTGTLTVNGAAPPDVPGSRGKVRLRTENRAAGDFPLSAEGPASFAGRVFAGSYDVFVDGYDEALPPSRVLIRRDWQATSEPVVFDLELGQLSFDVTLDGQPAEPAKQTRTEILFRRTASPVDPCRIDEQYASLPASGSTTSVALPFGVWEVWYYGHNGSREASLPTNMGRLGEVTISAASIERTLDIRSVALTVSLLRAGEPLGPTGPNMRHGTVDLYTRERGFVWLGSDDWDFALGGPATLQVHSTAGIFSMSLDCYDDCVHTLGGYYRKLVQSIRLDWPTDAE